MTTKTYILENQGKGTVSIQPEQLKKIAGATTSSGGTTVGVINKEYKISLSDLDVTGWEDPTFDDKVAEYIQTLDITVANNEIPYFVIEEPAEPSSSNFRIQADWGSLGVTDQTSFETWLTTPNDNGFGSEFGKYFIIDDQNLSAATYTISEFSLVNDVVTCAITGNGNYFDLGYCNIQEVISLPNNLIYLDFNTNQLTSFNPTNEFPSLQRLYLNLNQLTSFSPTNDLSLLQYLNLGNNQITSFNPTSDLPSLQELELNLNQLTSFNPTNEFPSLQRLYLSYNQISDWSQVTWIESIPNNGNAYLHGNPTSASSSPVYNALLAKNWNVNV